MDDISIFVGESNKSYKSLIMEVMRQSMHWIMHWSRVQIMQVLRHQWLWYG